MYPTEILRDQYLAILDIDPDTVASGQAGLSEEALRHTNIIPYQDRVFILDAVHPNKPLFFQTMFQIVPLEGDYDEVIVHESNFAVGSSVIINNVLRRLL